MESDAFKLGSNETHRFWATAEAEGIRMWRAPVDHPDAEPEVVGLFHRDNLRNLLIWADGESAVTSSMTGPQARAVRRAAQELGMTPEMFVWYATRSFMDIGGGH